MKKNLTMLKTNVLIKQFEAPEQTESGLFIPETLRVRPFKGTVISVGEGTKERPREVNVGDNVMYRKNAGKEFPYEGVTYLLMDQSDLIAII